MDFCMQVVKHLLLEEIKKPNHTNTVLSPLSLNVILNMIVAGTSGDTLNLLLGFLGSESVEEINKKTSEIKAVVNNVGKTGGPIVSLINGVWVDKRAPLKASYAELLKNIYNCQPVTNCDFTNKEEGVKLVDEINLWAKDASRGVIRNIINAIDSTKLLIQVNALYFKGIWSQSVFDGFGGSKPFEAKDTREQSFFLLDGTSKQVPFLTSWKCYDYGSFAECQVLRALYESGYHKSSVNAYGPYDSKPQTSFSMYLFLPNERNGLPNLLETYNSYPGNLFLNLHLKQTNLAIVQIPKFKFSYEIKMDTAMKSMGLDIPLNNNNLDYSGMIEGTENIFQSLKSSIIQKAFIEVDENGTTAFASTTHTAGYGSPARPPPRPKFVADHPFMFMIREDISGMVFFSGIVLNP